MEVNNSLNIQSHKKSPMKNDLFLFLMFCCTLLAFFFYYQLKGVVYIVALLWFFFFVFFNRSREKNWVTLFFIFLFIINFFATVVSFLNSGSMFIARVFLNATIYFCSGFAFFKYGCLSNYSDNKTPHTIVFVCALGLLNSFINLATWFFTTGGVISRYNFSSPINHSVSAGIGLSLIAAMLFLGLIKKHKIFGLFGFAVCSSNLLIILTRKTQLIFLLSLFLFFLIFLVKAKSLKTKATIILFAFAILGIVFFTFRNHLSSLISQFTKLYSLSGQDTIERNFAKEDSIALFKSSLGLGVGYGLFSSFSSFTILASAHNGFYAFLSEFGIAGVVLMFAFILQISIVSFCVVKKTSNILIWSISILILAIIYSFFIANSYLFPPANETAYFLENGIYWFLIGYLVSEYKRTKNKQNEKEFLR